MHTDNVHLRYFLHVSDFVGDPETPYRLARWPTKFPGEVPVFVGYGEGPTVIDARTDGTVHVIWARFGSYIV